MRPKLFPFLTLALALTLIPQFSAAAEKSAEKVPEKGKNDPVIKDGATVSIDYTLKGSDGKVIESSKGKEPLKYVHGQRRMIPGLEKALTGMKVGEQKNVTVKPENAYGPINKASFQEVPREKVPANGLKVGAILMAKSPDGQAIPMRVHEIKEKIIVMDMNHPMAGKTLVFDVKVVDIQAGDAPAKTGAPITPPAKAAAPAAPAAPAKPAEPAKK
ncbi:MAG: peptidylprolyl isomerase [Deltaproteobacteria bacterium]|nr:peptidylprolyl isomerase [Deltaproteobacteria bacterium]